MRYFILFALFCPAALGAEPRRDPYGDSLPDGATARLGSIRAHRDTLSWAAITPDGQRIVSGGMYDERRITVWEAATFKQIKILPTKSTNETWCVAVSPDGKRAGAILSSPGKREYDMSVVVWEIESGQCLCEVPLGKRNGGAERLAFSSDGKRFAAICEDLRVVEIETGKVVAQTKCSGRFSSLSFTGNDCFLLANHLRRLDVWDAATGKSVEVIADDRSSLANVFRTTTRDGKYFFVAGKTTLDRYRVQLPARSGEPAKLSDQCSIVIHDGDKVDCWPSPDGLRCVVRSSDGHVEIADFDRDKVTHTMELNERQLFDIAFPASGPLLLLRYTKNKSDSSLDVVDLVKGESQTRERGLHFVRGTPIWLPDGKQIRTDGQLWDAGSGRYLGEIKEDIPNDLRWKPPSDWPFSFSADSHIAVVAVGGLSWRALVNADGTAVGVPIVTNLEVWDMTANRRLRSLRGRDSKLRPIYIGPDVGSLSFDGRLFVYCDQDLHTPLEIWDTTFGRTIAVVDREQRFGELRSWTMAPDARRMFVVGTHGVGLYDLPSRTFESRIAFEPIERDPLCSAVSADWRLGAVSRKSGDLFIYDLTSGAAVAQIKTQQNRISRVSFSPDGRQVLTQGQGGWVHIWPVPELPAIPAAWTEAEFETAWKTLLVPNVADAAEAIRRWNRCGPSAVEFIGKRIETPSGPDENELTEMIDQLGTAQFARRETAQRELSKRGETIVHLLQKRLEKERDPEIRQRLQKIIDNPIESVLPVPSAEQLRCLRAIEILERIATPAAKSHVERLGLGPERDPLTAEAQAVLRRWK